MYNTFDIKGYFVYNYSLGDNIITQRKQIFDMTAGKEKELINCINRSQHFPGNTRWFVHLMAKKLKDSYISIQFEITKKTFSNKNILINTEKKSFSFENVEHSEIEKFFNETFDNMLGNTNV